MVRIIGDMEAVDRARFAVERHATLVDTISSLEPDKIGDHFLSPLYKTITRVVSERWNRSQRFFNLIEQHFTINREFQWIIINYTVNLLWKFSDKRETSKYDFSLSRNVFNQSSIPYLLLLKGILLIKWDEFARTFL